MFKAKTGRRFLALLLAILCMATATAPSFAMGFDDLQTVIDMTTGGENSGDDFYDFPEDTAPGQEEVPAPSEDAPSEEAPSAEDTPPEKNKAPAIVDSGTPPNDWLIPDDYVLTIGPAALRARSRAAGGEQTNIYHETDWSMTHRYPFGSGTSTMPAYIFRTADGQPAYCIEPAKFNSTYGHLVTGQLRYDKLSLTKQTEIAKAISANSYGTSDHRMYMACQYYTVVERQPPVNHLLDEDNTRTILIRPDALENNITLIFRNKEKPKILIEKVDKHDRPVPNCIFKVARRDSAEYQMVTTGPDGTALVEGLEEDWYQVSEHKAGDGHLIDGTVRDVQLVAGKTTTLRYVNFTKPSLTIKKIDEATGLGLDNAVVRVWREGVDEHQDYTTQGGGYIRLTDLEPGFILCQEVKSPAGFVLNDTIHRIELKAGEEHQLILKNQAVPRLTLRKIDEQTLEGIEKVTFRFSKDGEHRDVTTGANGIITESLEPGWWSYQEISCPDAYLLNSEIGHVELVAGENKEGLLSTVNNEIDCSRSALGLAAGEYVTEFRLVFQEDVQPGFHDLTGPKAEVRVRETVKDGQKFVNKVDVGGLYGGEWVYDTDGWTTVTFNKPKGKLPKTGW